MKFGTSNALTGPVASTCKPTSDGAAAWFKSVNASGGVDGHKIDYTALDDAYDPSKAVTNAHQLVGDKIIASVGGCATSTGLAMNGILKKAGISQVGRYTSLPSLSNDPSSLFFALVPLYGAQSAGLVQYALKSWKPGSVVAVDIPEPGMAEAVAVAKSATIAAGGTWLGDIGAPATESNFSALALKLKSEHPDYVLFIVTTSEVSQVLEAAKTAGFAPNKAYIGISTAASPNVATAAKGVVTSNFIVAAPTTLPGMQQSATCEKAIRDYGGPGTTVSGMSIYGCADAQLATYALSRIKGPVTASTFNSALQGLDHATVSSSIPPVTFTADDHYGLSSEYVFRYNSGEFVLDTTVPVPTDGKG